MIHWIYTTHTDNSARYTLGQKGDRMLFFIGINPSAAHPERPDRTVSRVRSFATDRGYDGWLMLNVYAQRATKPNDIHRQPDQRLHRENIKAIREVAQHRSFDVCAGWGVEINRRPYLPGLLKDVVEAIGEEAEWYHIGARTRHGHPRHPLYLPKQSEWYTFDIQHYLLEYA